MNSAVTFAPPPPARSGFVSVCTGSLILVSVGLQRGREVTTHWAYPRYLQNLGAHYVQKRFTVNGTIVSSAGVSAGIDVGLFMVARLCGDEAARKVQWLIQYDPKPPFGGIDYARLGWLPRLLRIGNGIRSYYYTSAPRRLQRVGA